MVDTSHGTLKTIFHKVLVGLNGSLQCSSGVCKMTRGRIARRCSGNLILACGVEVPDVLHELLHQVAQAQNRL